MFYISWDNGNKYDITDTSDGVTERYNMHFLEVNGEKLNVLGYNQNMRFANSISDEYFDLLNYMKNYVIKRVLAGSGTMFKETSTGRDALFIDVTDICDKYCIDRGIKKQKTVYYPKRKAKLSESNVGISYQDNSKSKLICRAWGEKLSLSDKVYYCNEDNHLYFLIITEYKNSDKRRIEAFRMVDFKSNYYTYM